MSEITEFDMYDESHCGMCGAPMAPGEGFEVEPGMPPVCAECAADYEESMGPPAPPEPDPDRAYDARVDRSRYGEGVVVETTEFDKFMDRIVIDEHRRHVVDKPEDNPQRRRAARYQDRPMNKTRVGGR